MKVCIFYFFLKNIKTCFSVRVFQNEKHLDLSRRFNWKLSWLEISKYIFTLLSIEWITDFFFVKFCFVEEHIYIHFVLFICAYLCLLIIFKIPNKKVSTLFVRLYRKYLCCTKTTLKSLPSYSFMQSVVSWKTVFSSKNEVYTEMLILKFSYNFGRWIRWFCWSEKIFFGYIAFFLLRTE